MLPKKKQKHHVMALNQENPYLFQGETRSENSIDKTCLLLKIFLNIGNIFQ